MHSRYAGAAHETGADVVVRITSDCPLIDPEISARVIEELTSHPGCDYVNNVSPRSYPRGLDTEAFTRETLDKMDRLATSQAAREHVTLFAVMEQPEMFVRRSVTDDEDNSDLRWTVDTPEDLSMMRRIYEGLRLAEHIAPYREVLAFVRAHPEISALNARVQQKSV